MITTSIVEATAGRNLPIPEGIALEFVHAQTRSVVQYLFSKKINGERFLAALLRYATLQPDTIRQYSLFRFSGEGNDTAVIFLQSIEALSKSEGWQWGYITTRKVIKILEALGILSRKRHQNYIELHLHLGKIEFPLRQILGKLEGLTHDKDPKLAQIARKAKRLLQEGNLFPDASTASNDPLLQAELRPVYHLLENLFQFQGMNTSPETQALLSQASELIAHTLLPEKYARPSGELSATLGNLVSLPVSRQQATTRTGKSVRCVEGNLEGATFPSSTGPIDEAVSDMLLPATEGNLEGATFPFATRVPLAEKGNLGGAWPTEFPEEGLNSPLRSQKGDLDPNVTNVNRNYILLNKVIDDNVTREENSPNPQQGNLLAQALDDSENAQNYAFMLSHSDPRIAFAVFLYVAQQKHLREHKNSIQNAGKYYTTMWKLWNAYGTYEKACAAYQEASAELGWKGGKTTRIPGIPLDIQGMVEHFWDWPYADIVKEIRTSPVSRWRKQGNSLSSPAPTSSLWSDDSTQDQSEPRVPTRSGWIEHVDQARALRARIEREALAIPDLDLQFSDPCPRPYRIRGTQRTVYVLDLLIEGVPYICAEAEQWDDYYLPQIKE
jgi:hypothetical protein